MTTHRAKPDSDLLESALLSLPGILTGLDPSRLISELTSLARQLTGADFAMCWASLEGFAEVEELTIEGAAELAFTDRPDPQRAPLLAGCLDSDKVLRIDDLARWAPSEESARPYGSLSDGRRVRSYLAAPMRSRSGSVLGAMYAGHTQPRAFDRRDERLLEGMGNQLAVALDNAAVFHQQARVARSLEETLLPPMLPVIPHADVAARYQATGSGNMVGGDFYDVFEIGSLESGKAEWGVVLGDVSGVGHQAAALTGLARYTVRAVARHQRPAEVLASLNEALNRQRDDDRFCTAVYATIRASGTGIDLTIASGGHPPPIVLRDDGSVESLEGIPGLLLGQFPDAGLAERQLTLAPGDALVLYTDGVLEARDDSGEQFDTARLHAVLARSAGRTADGIARRVELAALDFQGGTARDDVAVVVVRART